MKKFDFGKKASEMTIGESIKYSGLIVANYAAFWGIVMVICNWSNISDWFSEVEADVKAFAEKKKEAREKKKNDKYIIKEDGSVEKMWV